MGERKVKNQTRYLRLLLITLNAIMLLGSGYLVWSNSQVFAQEDLLFLSLAILGSLIANIYLSIRILPDRKITKMLRQYETYEGTLLPLIDEVRAIQHDFKNHLNTLDGVVRANNGKTDQDVKLEIESYISGLNSVMGELEHILQINNGVIGVLLYSRSSQAKARNVSFYQDIPPYQVEIPLNSYEYLAVLNLLFEQAFASVQAQEVRKEIIFRLDHEQGKPFFEVANNGRQQANVLKSIKDIRQIIRQYRGRIIVLNQPDGIAYRIQFG
jgi:two-component system, LytTR family, sensor histidine kinase AgrC